MENKQGDNSIKSKVLEAIETGRVKMKPRWEFVLQSILVIFGVVILALTLLYLFSFIIFILRQSGLWFVPAFGYRGLFPFFTSLPWLLILLTIIALGVLEVLVKKFSFVYRKPVLYSLVAIIVLVLFGSVLVANSQFHRGMFERAQDNHLPLAGGLYKEYGSMKMNNMVEGVVKEIQDTKYIIENRRGDIIEVVLSQDTNIMVAKDLVVGDIIVVIGKRNNGSIDAQAIREVKDFPSMPGRKMQGFPPPMMK